MGGAAGEMKNKAKLSQSWAGLSLATFVYTMFVAMFNHICGNISTTFEGTLRQCLKA